MKKTILLMLACCLAAESAVLRAAGHPAAQQFGETASVVAVEVPVQVNVNGQPVRGLTQQSFEVYDGRDKQQITGFSVVDLKVNGTSATAEDVPISGRRHFLVLFDLANSEPSSILRARRAAADVVAKLRPTDMV